MNYYQVSFTLTPSTEAYRDVFEQLAADIGFESFTADGTGYIQQKLFDREALDALIRDFPLPEAHIIYKVEEAEDRDWNEPWEAEGFEPITLGRDLVVCDARTPVIRLAPRQAFGTGTHPTTRTLLGALLALPLEGKRVVDAGCGTGVLGILAALRGASEVLAYDVDPWSVENTRHNAALNHAASITVREGDARVLDGVRGVDLLVANIFREIIIADLPRFAATLTAGGRVLLSGFYTRDAAAVIKAAQAVGLTLESQDECEGWAVLQLVKSRA